MGFGVDLGARLGSHRSTLRAKPFQARAGAHRTVHRPPGLHAETVRRPDPLARVAERSGVVQADRVAGYAGTGYRVAAVTSPTRSSTGWLSRRTLTVAALAIGALLAALFIHRSKVDHGREPSIRVAGFDTLPGDQAAASFSQGFAAVLAQIVTSGGSKLRGSTAQLRGLPPRTSPISR